MLKLSFVKTDKWKGKFNTNYMYDIEIQGKQVIAVIVMIKPVHTHK